MRITTAAPLLLVQQILAASSSDGPDSVAVALPACAEDCSELILAKCHYAPGEPCCCNANGPLQKAQFTCVQDSCTGVGGTSAPNATAQAQKLRAEARGYSNRDRSSLVLGISFALFGLATLIFFAKSASRFTAGSWGNFDMEDTAVALTYTLLVGLAVSTYYSHRNGLGSDVWDVDADHVAVLLKWNFISSILYVPIVFGAKVALVRFYLRTWPGHDKHWFVLCSRSTTVALVGIGIAAVFATIFACSPIELNWSTTPRPNCAADRVAVLYTFGGFDAVLNITVFLLPMSKLLRHRSAVAPMTGVLVAYLFGIVSLACSIGRLTAISNVDSTDNPTWDLVPLVLWSIVECNSSVICCCIPAFRVWLQRWKSNEASFCGARLTGDDRPRWSLRRSSIRDQEAPLPNITPLSPIHSRQGSWEGSRSLRVQLPTWDEKSWRPSGEMEIEEGAQSPPAEPREHHMEAMVKIQSEIKFPRRAYAPPVQPTEPRTPTRNNSNGVSGYYFDGRRYVGLHTPPTGPVTPVLFNIDEENEHSQLRSTSDLRLDRGS
ncbi:hypothetical protein DOTSEDRAFT_171447 [Dothistroma septosporum NZE10]|uniref:Rhodopsin domain-containing protein n=1 Tax=Dothistroma septosporum (strain NZE10 / CBS 128990) TaxID=675120 RepID=N1PR11_DOTSN|nr:hypothetical protein DOTSEDRAFT_171447 [Dothistroma septosporum NZE10]